MELKIGDWVTSYSSGIWQIYKILNYKGINPVSGLEKEITSIFSKRFLSKSFKSSFKEECCSPDFVDKLDHETTDRLKKFIKENDELVSKFKKYLPKKINSVYNARIGIPKGKNAKEAEAIISKDRAFNVLEINQHLDELGFNTKELPSWTAQFVSEDFKCQNGYLVYNFKRILWS